MPRRFPSIGYSLLFLTLSLLCYWPSFSGERIWDDHFLVGSNPFFRSPYLLWEAYHQWLYPFSATAYFRPTQNLSYTVDYWFWGEELFGYHLTNALLHGVAAILLALVLRKVVKAALKNEPTPGHVSLIAWGSALLWLVHPIHHAGVAYVSGRADSLAALFSLSAWLLSEHAFATDRIGKRVAQITGAVICGGLALCSKEIALTWFGLFAVYHLTLRSGRTYLQRFFPICAAGFLVFIYALHRSNLAKLPAPDVTVSVAAATFTDRCWLVLKALGDYISLIFCPVNLHMDRTLSSSAEVLASSGLWLQLHDAILLPLGLITLVGFAWLCTWRSESRALYRFAVCWFLIGFFPISNLFPLNAQVAEHWIYMPSAAILLITTHWLASLPRKASMISMILLSTSCLILVMLTRQQSHYWLTGEGLFRTTFARGGDNSRTRAGLAYVLETQGKLKEAERVLTGALTQSPRSIELRTQLAGVLIKLSRPEEAFAILRAKTEPQKPHPVPWMAEFSEAMALFAMNRNAEAEHVLITARQRWPLAWELVGLQAAHYSSTQDHTRAAELLGRYVQMRWWHYPAVIALAQSLEDNGKDEEAIEKYQLAAKLDVRSVLPLEQIAAIRFRQERYPEALQAQTRAVDRDPYSPLPRQRLAEMYASVGRNEEALIERLTPIWSRSQLPKIQRGGRLEPGAN